MQKNQVNQWKKISDARLSINTEFDCLIKAIILYNVIINIELMLMWTLKIFFFIITKVEEINKIVSKKV